MRDRRYVRVAVAMRDTPVRSVNSNYNFPRREIAIRTEFGTLHFCMCSGCSALDPWPRDRFKRQQRMRRKKRRGFA